MKNPYIEKVQKLLALSENNPSPEESKAALLKAQEMMIKHSIKTSDLEHETSNITEIYVDGGRSSSWRIKVAKTMADNFRCSVLRTSKGLVFIGEHQDVELCSSLYAFAIKGIEKEMSKIRKLLRKAGTPLNGQPEDYAKGFARGLYLGFAEQVTKNNWGLVLVKSQELQVYMDKITSTAPKYNVKQKPTMNLEEFERGTQDGKLSAKGKGIT